MFTLLVLTSFTHGYLPYGSSDVLLPSLVAFGWAVEFLPRYGGAADPQQVRSGLFAPLPDTALFLII